MPLYGLVKDSPIIYAAGRAYRSTSRSVRNAARAATSGGSGLIGLTSVAFELNNVTIYDTILRIELQTQAGSVWRYLERRGRLAMLGARSQVGVKTGRLRSSIGSTHTIAPYGQKYEIHARTPYAYYHHEGTRPHIIEAQGNGVLVFSKGSKVIRTPKVNHPGTRANKFLSSQLYHFFT